MTDPADFSAQDSADSSMPDQQRSPAAAQETEEQAPAEPVAVRRIKNLRAKYPEETPAQIAERLEQRFIRDFVLVGSAEVGATSLVPSAVNVATRHSKVAGLTRAASYIGVVKGAASYTQKTAQGVSTAAHVGSSQAIKTYIYSLALLHGMRVEDSDDAAEEVLDGDVHQLLRTMDQPIAHEPEQKGVNPLNVISAISQIGMRNPQMFLLVKSGEQLVRSGGSVMAASKARREFAQQLVAQVRDSLGEISEDFPSDFAHLEQQEIPEEQEVEATPAEEVKASSAEELQEKAKENTASVRGAKFAARAFMRGSEKFKSWNQK